MHILQPIPTCWSRSCEVGGAQQSHFTKPSSSDAGAAEVRATAHLGSAQDHSDTSISTIAKHKQTQTNDKNPPFI